MENGKENTMSKLTTDKIDKILADLFGEANDPRKLTNSFLSKFNPDPNDKDWEEKYRVKLEGVIPNAMYVIGWGDGQKIMTGKQGFINFQVEAMRIAFFTPMDD